MQHKPYHPSDLNVIVADDSVEWRDQWQTLLAATGLTSAVIVDDGRDILNALQKPDHGFHLIVTDNQMYNVCGHQVLAYVATLPRPIPTIMASSSENIRAGLTGSDVATTYRFARFILKDDLNAPTLTAAMAELLPAVDFGRTC